MSFIWVFLIHYLVRRMLLSPRLQHCPGKALLLDLLLRKPKVHQQSYRQSHSCPTFLQNQPTDLRQCSSWISSRGTSSSSRSVSGQGEKGRYTEIGQRGSEELGLPLTLTYTEDSTGRFEGVLSDLFAFILLHDLWVPCIDFLVLSVA